MGKMTDQIKSLYMAPETSKLFKYITAAGAGYVLSLRSHFFHAASFHNSSFDLLVSWRCGQWYGHLFLLVFWSIQGVTFIHCPQA